MKILVRPLGRINCYIHPLASNKICHNIFEYVRVSNDIIKSVCLSLLGRLYYEAQMVVRKAQVLDDLLLLVGIQVQTTPGRGRHLSLDVHTPELPTKQIFFVIYRENNYKCAARSRTNICTAL